MTSAAEARIEVVEAGAAAEPRAIAPLARKGTLAIADQALFSGANFAVNILLARWLAPTEYGAYSLAYSAFLLFAAAHSALFIEPMMIFGAGKYAHRFPQYLRRLIGLHAAILAPAGVGMWIAATLLGRVYSAAAKTAFQGLILGAAFILLFWMVRRVFYVLSEPQWGVLSSLLYCATLAASASVLWIAGWLTPFSAFAGMGVASLLSSAILLTRFRGRAADAGPSFREVAREHWHYGRWAVAAAAMSWLPANLYFGLLPAWLGLEGSAGLRALTNFTLPLLQAIAALSMLLLPTLVRDRAAGGSAQMNRTMARYLGLFCAGSLTYLIALWVFRAQLFGLFYEGRYSEYAGWPLLLAGALPIGTCATAVLSAALRAMERPDQMFRAYAISAAAGIAAGVPLAMKFGVAGALAGIHISSFTLAAAQWRSYRSLSGRHT